MLGLIPSDDNTVAIWGRGLFENGNARQVFLEFDEQAGIKKMQDDANIGITDPAKRIYYTMFNCGCRPLQANVERIRDHLDSGVLAKLAAKQVAAFFNLMKVEDWTAYGYSCIILAACAIGLGCRTYKDLKGYHMYFDTYDKFVRAILPAVPLYPESYVQMKVALDCYKPGNIFFFPYRAIERLVAEKLAQGLTEAQAKPPFKQLIGGLAVEDMATFKREQIAVLGMIGPCTKADMDYKDEDGLCGNMNCGKRGAALKCGKCKDQNYCDTLCQKADWNRHKACCRTPKDREFMKNCPEMWSNIFDMGKAEGPLVPGLF